MLFQVIYCHPVAESYNHALFETIVATLQAQGHEVVGTDLYRDGFDPTMTEIERRTYNDGPYDDSAVRNYTAFLRRVDGIVLCFPHWWFSMPAVLKGYFDRVWGPGIAFEHDQVHGNIKPLLHHIKVFGVVTSYGTPWWVTRVLMGDPGRRVTMRCLKPLCGSQVRSFYLAHYDMDRSTPKSRQAFIERVRATVSRY